MENEMRDKKPMASDPVKPTVKGGRGKSMDEMVDRATGNFYSEKTAPAEEPKKATYKTAEKKVEKSGKTTAKRSNIIVQVLNGDILTRDVVLNNLTFVFFILFLLLLMVGKGYYGKQLTKDINDLQTEVDASTAEYIENKAKLEEETARFRLVKALERRGLKETVNPAKVIRIKQPEQ